MNPSLLATLGLDVAGFRAGIRSSEQGLKTLEQTVKESAAVIAVLEQRMRGGGTAEQGRQLDQLRAKHREYQVELKNTQRQLAAMHALENGGANGHANGGNKAMLAHSARASLEMVMAGQSPLQALQIEAPKIIQANGGGLGAMLGFGAAIAAVNKVVEGITESIVRTKELGNEFRTALRPAPSQGVESIEAMQKRLEELNAIIEKGKPKLGFFEKAGQNFADSVGSAKRQLLQMFTGQTNPFSGALTFSGDVPEDGNSQVKTNEDLRNKALEEREHLHAKIAAQLGEENAIREKAFAQGQAAAKQDELKLEHQRAIAAAEEELGIPKIRAEIEKIEKDPDVLPGMKKKRIAQIEKDELEPALKALAPRTTEINRSFEPKDASAQIAVNDEADRFKARRDKVEALHPDLKERDGEIQIVDTAAEGKAVIDARIEMEAARTHLNTVQSRGGDDREAKVALQEKTAALIQASREADKEMEIAKGQTRELQLQMSGHGTLASIEASRLSYHHRILAAQREGKHVLAEQIKLEAQLAQDRILLQTGYGTTTQKAQERADQLSLKNAQESQRANVHGTRDASKDGSFIRDAGTPDPERQSTAAVGSAANMGASSFDTFFKKPLAASLPEPEKMPELEGYDSLDTAAEIRAGAENAGKSDTEGVDNEGIIQAINNPEWAKNLSLKNK